jgi:hypothetical protein
VAPQVRVAPAAAAATPGALAGGAHDAADLGRGGRVGLALALLLTTPPFVASVAFLAGVALSPLVVIAGVATACAMLARTDGRRAWPAIAIALAIILVALTAASFPFDMSFDGQTYHQSAIRYLAHGWNPVADPGRYEHAANGTYIASLPKAAWILAAATFQATRSLEAAKGVQLAMLVAAFLLARHALRATGVGRRPAMVVAALAAANPVTLTQLVSFYVDGLMASAIVMVAALAVLHMREGRRWLAPLAMTTAFLANVKFPGLVYASLVAGAVVAYTYRRARDRMRPTFVALACCAATTVAAGVNPYITNAMRHGNPVYPVAGLNASQTVVHFDTVFAREPRPLQLVRALASESSDIDDRPPRLKVPFSVHRSELAAFGTVDTRIGGLGPLFGGVLLVAWGVLAAAVVAGRPNARLLAAISAGIFVSALAIPFGYYSRYAPQLWLAPLPALLGALPRARVARLLAAAIAVNAVFVGSVSLAVQLFEGALQREQLRTLARDAGGGEVTYAQHDAPFLNVDLHFDRFGIRHRAVPVPTCPEPAGLLMTHTLVCLPDGRSPAPAPDPARVAARWMALVGR